MLIVFICIAIIICVIIFGFLSYNDHKKVRQSYFTELDQAAAKLSIAQRSFELLDKPIQALIKNQFGKKMAENVATETISTGMHAELLLTSWGQPEVIETEEEGERWCYDSFTDKQQQKKFRTEIVMRNSRIASWKDFE